MFLHQEHHSLHKYQLQIFQNLIVQHMKRTCLTHHKKKMIFTEFKTLLVLITEPLGSISPTTRLKALYIVFI